MTLRILETLVLHCDASACHRLGGSSCYICLPRSVIFLCLFVLFFLFISLFCFKRKKIYIFLACLSHYFQLWVKSFWVRLWETLCSWLLYTIHVCVFVHDWLDVLYAHTCWMSLLFKSFHEIEYLNLFGVIMLFLMRLTTKSF